MVNKKIKNIIFVFSLMVLVFQAIALAAVATSDAFSLSAAVVDVGGTTAESSSHSLIGKFRARSLDDLTSSLGSFRLGEGFIRSVYFVAAFDPFAVTVTPNFGRNDTSVFVTVSGGNFVSGATTVELSLAGETNVVASNVTVVDNSTITFLLDLVGVVPGIWNLSIVNNGNDVEMLSPTSAFEVRGSKLKIIGPALNYPNPFSPERGPTLIKYTLTRDARITFLIFNIIGEKILSRTFPAGTEGGKAGDNTVTWDGEDVFGSLVPNNVYLCKVITSKGEVLATIKIAVLR